MILEIDIDTSSTPSDQITQIDGVEYLLRFAWSERESLLYMHIFDQDENPIALCIAIVINTNLLRRFQDPRLPTGRLLAVDLSQSDTDAQALEEFGSRVILTYITPDDPLLAPAAGQ